MSLLILLKNAAAPVFDVEARFSAVAAESLFTVTRPDTQISAVAAESLVTVTRPDARISAVAIEVLVTRSTQQNYIGWGQPA